MLERSSGVSGIFAFWFSVWDVSALRQAFPNAEVVIHQDPFGLETPRVVEP